MKIVFVTRDVPNPNTGGGRYKLQVLNALVREGHEVVWLRVGFATLAEQSAFRQVLDPKGIRFSTIPISGSRFAPLWHAKFLLAGRRGAPDTDKLGFPTTYDAPMSSGERIYLQQALTDIRADVVIADFVWMAPVFESPAARGAKKILFSNDLISARNQSFVDLGLPAPTPHWTVENETNELRKADAIIAIQSDEADQFRKLCPNATVITTSVSFEPEPYVPSPKEGPIFFVGARADHNSAGLLWFFREVWQRVRATNKEIELHVVGGVCETLSEVPEGVKLLGKVESVREHYLASTLTISPLIAGSGLKIKALEAFTNGRINIATTIGAQGLHDYVENGLITVDSPQALAELILYYYVNVEERHAQEAKATTRITSAQNDTTVHAELLAYLETVKHTPG